MTATPRSGAGRAPAVWPLARILAAAAGRAPTRPSAGSTRDPRTTSPDEPREEAALMAAPALVALAHGSRDPRSSATVTALVDEVKALRPDLRIEKAFLELSRPSFDTVVDRLVRAGYDEIVVVPLLLVEAFH